MPQVSVPASIPAPIGGLNARDSLAAMPPTDAVILENWFPQPTSVNVRKGYTPWATGFANPVQTIFRYAPTSGAYKMFAASGTGFYDTTLTGPIGAPVVTGLTNAQWCYTNIITPGGSFLWTVNGQDNAKIYDGATWADVSITGIASNLLAQVNVFGNRLFMIEKNKLKVWYLGVQSIAGAATAFDLSTIFPRGGYLMAMGTWSIDAGAGLNDLAVFVSSEGEVAVYQGIDPATWTKQGVYYLGRPIGRKCFAKMGGDFLLLCEQGIYPLSRALLSATIDRSVALTDKIQNLISQSVSAYQLNYGWQMTVYPEQNQLWLNVPTGNGGSYQYVMNTITSAWCYFTNMNSTCWEVIGPSIYYGGQTAVYKAWTGPFDNTSQIQADVLQAYSNFGTQANQKYFTMVRPAILADGDPSILFALNVDFLNLPPTGALSFNPPINGMVWGSMVWGSMVWGGGMMPIGGWQTVGAIGTYAGFRMTVQANGSNVSWNEISMMYQVGGPL
jgi:hypothetical protein